MSLATLFRPWLAPLMRQRLLCRLLLIAVLVLGVGAWQGWGLWVCPFATVTGLPCHGCGMTRAFLALLRGDWGTALQFHPFAPFFALVGLVCSTVALLPQTLAEPLGDHIERFERKTRLPALVLILFACFGLLRMLGLWYLPPTPKPLGTFKRVFTAEGTHQAQP